MSGEIRAARLRMGAVGLSPRNELLLRSVVRIIRTQTQRVWEFVDEPPYDVVVRGAQALIPIPPHGHLTSIPDGPIVIEFVDQDQPDHAAGPLAAASFTLQPPIMPDDLTRLLDAVGARLPVDRGWHAITVPRSHHGLATKTVWRPGASADDLQPVVRMLQLPRRLTYVARVADRPVAVIDPSARTWRIVRGDDGVEPTTQSIVALLGRGPVRYPEASPDDLALPLGRTLPIDVLLWHVGLVVSPGDLLPQISSRTHVKLARWPDFGRIGADHAHLKMSAMLTSRAYELDDLFLAAGERRERVVAFLNACAVCGLLTEAVDAESPAFTPRGAPRGRPLGALMQRLRGALGIGRI